MYFPNGFKTTYINIDSRFRNKESKSNTLDYCLMEKNPLKFKKDSKVLRINHKNHNFKVGDSIQIENVSAKQLRLHTFDTNGRQAFVIPNGHNFIKIFCTHGLPSTYDGDSLEIKIDGIKGDKSDEFLGNIPTNIINSRHRIRLSLPKNDKFPTDYFIPNPNYFFILLPISMKCDFILDEYNFRLTFLYIAGIPLNLLNAKYPTSIDSLQGYHVIQDTKKNYYKINLSTYALCNDVSGGNNVNISLIKSINNGYPNPNNYSIDIGKIFNNILSVRLVSFEFPYSHYNIEEGKNDKIYWNNIDDGDYLYQVRIPAGNYEIEDIVCAIEKLCNRTKRNTGNSHNFKITYNKNTNTVSFKSFKKIYLESPFILVEIIKDGKIITINHPNHCLHTGDKIYIEVYGSYGEIDKITGKHIIYSIIDDDHYKILISGNFIDVDCSTRKQFGIIILVEDLFRLRFDFVDTVGELLGFNNVGKADSIFPFSKKISNYISNENVINNYVLLSIKQFDNYSILNTGPIKSFFGKILLDGKPGRVLFDTFVPTTTFYNSSSNENIINDIDHLDVTFYNPDGSLHNFNGIDHSFTLELVTLQENLLGAADE